MQAADFLNDKATLAHLCWYAASWLFDHHTKSMDDGKHHIQQRAQLECSIHRQQQSGAVLRLGSERMKVRFCPELFCMSIAPLVL